MPVLFSLVKGDGQPLESPLNQGFFGTLLCIPLHGLGATPA
jgi:hypothetical protein